MEGFSDLLWQWYGAEQEGKIAAISRLVGALEFLAADAAAQRDIIPDCPVCEAWSSHMLLIQDAISICGATLPDEIRSELDRVWELCSAIHELNLPCHDRDVFEQQPWQPLRAAAGYMLLSMGAVEVKKCLAELSP
ncbi:hypothetical protein [Pseudomonas sp. PDM22]|uniref:hypothetical protein n=1 Tax=Pseudomonas sp. PDM22 TaxID=2769287 RepID=UPI001782E53F|nr:hypothetical protein [Pseudomonas sp. PDM22]MBD9516043.1 hypothetical protein [Pseudomonas sp. PDM22]